MPCLFSENAEQRNDGGQIRCHDWFGGSSTRCGTRGTKPGTAFCCASYSRSSITECQIVGVDPVPQSVPRGTPRKPLQGLDVPQFHDFRRMGEKNTEKRSAHIPGKRAPARPAPQAPCAPRPERRTTDPQTREKSPTTPVSRPVCGRERQSADGERRNDQKEEKHRFFSPILADFRRIYFKAGISVAVTSARNSGQRRRKTASLREFEGSDK